MASFYCYGCQAFMDFDKLFEDYDEKGYCSECDCDIIGRLVGGSKPVDCAPTCANTSLCEHSCVGYVLKEM